MCNWDLNGQLGAARVTLKNAACISFELSFNPRSDGNGWLVFLSNAIVVAYTFSCALAAQPSGEALWNRFSY